MTNTKTKETTDGQNAGPETVTIGIDHAETLLEVAGTLLEDIGNGRAYGHDDEETRENTEELADARHALRVAIDEHEQIGRWDDRPAESDLRERADEVWGTEAQINKAAEVLSEIAAALNRHINGQQDPDEAGDEFVDARVMLWQMEMLWTDDQLTDRLDVLIDDLEERIERFGAKVGGDDETYVCMPCREMNPYVEGEIDVPGGTKGTVWCPWCGDEMEQKSELEGLA